MQDHPLFKGDAKITPGYKAHRSKCERNGIGKIEIVAEWADGVPVAAVRYDLPGIITSLGFLCGSQGSQDGLHVVINALCLIR